MAARIAVGIRVHADEPFNFYVQVRLFFGFADGGVLYGFAYLYKAAWQGPHSPVRFCAATDQDYSVLRRYDYVYHNLRCLWSCQLDLLLYGSLRGLIPAFPATVILYY